MITPAQCRAARGLLDWTQSDLSAHSSLSAATIRSFEKGGPMRVSNKQLLAFTFAAAGVIFTSEPDGSVGVRLATPSPPPSGD